MMSGNAILAMQYALNELGYSDENGNRLAEDGKCGAKTMFAVDAFANNQQTVCSMLNGPTFVIPSENGAARLTITVEE